MGRGGMDSWADRGRIYCHLSQWGTCSCKMLLGWDIGTFLEENGGDG